MKVVHINKKNFERERAMKTAVEELQEKRSQLEYKRYLRLKAKREEEERWNQEHGIQKPSVEEIIQLESRGKALLELARAMRKRL